ncbi:hypothetical protein BW33_05109 [Pseudomonas sp. RIT288]|nr:hypothetical protein BW33_05109 [Pseudomonas sp. RIT288]
MDINTNGSKSYLTRVNSTDPSTRANSGSMPKSTSTAWSFSRLEFSNDCHSLNKRTKLVANEREL